MDNVAAGNITPSGIFNKMSVSADVPNYFKNNDIDFNPSGDNKLNYYD